MESNTLRAFIGDDIIDIHAHRVLKLIGIQLFPTLQRSNDSAQSGTIGILPFRTPFVDGVVGTFRFACTTVDAFVGNHYSHSDASSGSALILAAKIGRPRSMGLPLQQRIGAFVQLGRAMASLSASGTWPGYASSLTEEEFNAFQGAFQYAQARNGWFTPDAIRQSLSAWGNLLTEDALTYWLGPYNLKDTEEQPVTVGVICAGNIPLVGLHDVLSILLTGNRALIKLSDNDEVLMRVFLDHLVRIEPGFKESVRFAEGKLQEFDAVIATGSNNTARYFEYYFSRYPHIIRKGRTSVAVLSGSENPEDFNGLGHDIFDYFGLGCRSVSKLFLPRGYKLDHFFEGIFEFREIIQHNKYANNYDYNKAVWLLNKEHLLDNGFILLKKDAALASPTGSLFYEFYDDPKTLGTGLNVQAEFLQCIIGEGYLPFGEAQRPGLADYADGVDTLQFLLNIPR